MLKTNKKNNIEIIYKRYINNYIIYTLKCNKCGYVFEMFKNSFILKKVICKNCKMLKMYPHLKNKK